MGEKYAVGGNEASSEDRLINYCSVCSYTDIKASSMKGSLISSSVPFQVVPFILPRKFCLLLPLISNKRDLQPHPPTQWWAGEGLEHHPEYTVSSLHLSMAKGSSLQYIKWYHSFLFKRSFSTERQHKNVLSSIIDMNQEWETAQMPKYNRTNVMLCVLMMKYYISMKMDELQFHVTT